MKIKEVLKKNTTMNRLGKKINVYRECINDAQKFSKYYIENSEKNCKYEYTIMLLVHSLEKGMCMSNPRPFGNQKIDKLINILGKYSDTRKEEFEYKLGISALYAYMDFYKNHGWQENTEYIKVNDFLKGIHRNSLQTGCKEYTPDVDDYSFYYFERIFLSRHSVRDYKNEKLRMEDIQFAIECFIEAPTACNRQMCKIYYIEDIKVKEILNNTVVGISGFNKKTVNFFVITYDLAAFAYSGERQQGMFNAGLCTMNFINGLHAKGIGSCCLQWSNKKADEQKISHLLKLKESERIAVVIGAGYYLNNTVIPCSVRKSKKEIFNVI